MLRRTIAFVVLAVCSPSAQRTWAEDVTNDDIAKRTDTVVILLDEATVTDKALEVRYHIKNSSGGDIWLCDSMNADSVQQWHFEAFLDEDEQTLLVQRRLGIPMEGARDAPVGLYSRLPSGETRTEMMSLPLPVRHRQVLSARGTSKRLAQVQYARRLALRIGWYEGNLPAGVLGMMREAEGRAPDKPIKESVYWRLGILSHGGSLAFIVDNESPRARDHEVLVPWTRHKLEDENVLEIAVDDLPIPYSGPLDYKPTPPDLGDCTRMEVRFRRAPLEFFFPYAQEQMLLDPQEKRYLQSLDVLQCKDPAILNALPREIAEGLDDGFIVDRGIADLTCYRDSERLASFTVSEDTSILTQQGQVLRFPDGIRSLKRLTPQIQSFEWRIRCAANLKNLWHQMRLYNVAQHAPRDLDEYWANEDKYGYPIPPAALRGTTLLYPRANQWCTALLRGYYVEYGGHDDSTAILNYRCPSPDAKRGKCHYAMNPDCKPDSPPDTVLLFEAKAGWNRYGGPKLFAFDNHDPKGGLVLLNDGTVKFIRTEEELKQLRWK